MYKFKAINSHENAISVLSIFYVNMFKIAYTK